MQDDMFQNKICNARRLSHSMSSREGKPQKCKGILGSLTQTGAEERMSVVGLKEGDQGFMHKPEFPQNHIPELKPDLDLPTCQTQQ
jgi:hypothetical protein